MSSFRRALGPLLLASSLAAGAAVGPASAHPVPEPAPATRVPAGPVPAGPAPAPVPASTGTATLVTGDRVTLGPATATGEPSVLVEPRERATNRGYSVRRDDGRVTVVPHDVERLVPDVLDPALFDVTGLLEMGYDDQRRPDLPLIVREAPGNRATAATTTLSGSRRLASIDATAGSLAKDRAGAFGSTLAAARSGPALRASTGLTKVWLDRAVRSSAIDPYLSQVKAPAAWETGLDGAGVTVAVLDTGIDTGHPALAGQVGTEADFTGTGSTVDDNGHGTHVASLIAGTGAGADSARQGIAPAADLLSGKVLDSAGRGQSSWVIAGMEWAVAQGADVVNLSLGGRAGETDDPVSTAVDDLTASSGTLFVVAAGNGGGLGGAPYTIESPGIAASALTVGAVTANDVRAIFSSEGPTRGTYRAKPDLGAPGVGILGARAGARDENLYVPVSGTSQATPLVAGAAALLMQRRPEWSWQQVKTGLVGTADHTGGWPLWSVGAGRLDLSRIAGQALTADVSSLDFALVRYPDESPRGRTVTFTNAGSAPVTLTATDAQNLADGTAADAEAVTVTPATVTVPAGGTASTTVTADPGRLADGIWQGDVTFRDAGQAEVLRLPLGLYDEAERYDVRLQVLDRDGAPFPYGPVTMFNAATGGFRSVPLDASGAATVRVEPGPFSVFARVVTPAGATTPESLTLAGTPELTVAADTTYTIDARTAVPVRAPRIDKQPTRVLTAGLSMSRHNEPNPSRRGFSDFAFFTPEEIAGGQAFVTPTEPVSHGDFEAGLRWRLEPTERSRPGGADRYELLNTGPAFTDPVAPDLDASDVRGLARVENTFAGLGAPGTYAYERIWSTTETGVAWTIKDPVDVPGSRVELVTADPDTLWRQCYTVPGERVVRLCGDQHSHQPGETVRPAFGTGLHPEPTAAAHRATSLFAEVGLGDDGGHYGTIAADAVESSSLTLYRDGALVGERTGLSATFPVPAGEAGFRLEHRLRLKPDRVPVARTADTVWELTSAPPADPTKASSTVPSLIDVDYRLAVDGLGGIRPNRSLPVDLAVGHPVRTTAPSTITGATLSFSVDDGATWQSLGLRRTGAGRWTTMVPGAALRAGTTLTLRSTATDASGGSVTQTVVGIATVR